MPNLSCDLPVVIYLCVWASISGLIRNDIEAVFPIEPASWSIICISGIDSQLNEKISPSSAILISLSDLPTPAYTTADGSKPEFRASFTSLPLTQSAPKP